MDISSSTNLDSFVLVNAKTVHQTENLFAVLPNACFALSRQRLLVKNRPLNRNTRRHPLVLFDLSHGQTLQWVQHQHPADQVLTV